jgi:hypothetical protein
MPAPRANPARPVKALPQQPELPRPPQARPIPPDEHVGVAPLMIASLPPIASGADVYARQFYRGSRVPFRRYLPITGQ